MDFHVESGVVTMRVPFYVGTPGLSGFTVIRQRANNSSVDMSTPTIAEDSHTPGLYRLTLDEDTTITSGQTVESLYLIIKHDGAGYWKELRGMIYSNLKADVKLINSAPVFGSGTVGDMWEGDGF